MWCREAGRRWRRGVRAGWLWAGAAAALALPAAAGAALPAWMQHIVGATTVEAALYRAMQLPAVQALYPRPPKEAAAQLSQLLAGHGGDAELYQLRARAEEQALDEAGAEADWKQYAAHAADPAAGKLELADFYERRLMPAEEIAVLREVAAAGPVAAEAYVDPAKQRSWLAFERILGTIYRQGLPAGETERTFAAFVARYPDEPAVYAAYLEFELEQQNWAAAQALIGRYGSRFPQDAIFPIRAQALLEFRRGNMDAALAVYDGAFQPLWPAELVEGYFGLLEQTHRQRAFVAAARAELAAHPDGPEALNALARIFYYDELGGRGAAAGQTLEGFRVAREARGGAWTAADLWTLAALCLRNHEYAEAARYDYALASVEGAAPNGEPAAEAGLAGLVEILLEAPEQPLAIGAQNLTLYRDIATLDQGPGYWNGILSLWLNGESPEAEYQAETERAQSYFHRAKAAELLGELDRRFPAAPERAGLHAALMRALAQYGEPATVIAAGRDFMAAFGAGPERLEVAGLMADAYARENDTADEFALYDAELNELGAKTAGLPLTSSANAPAAAAAPGTVDFYVQVEDPEAVNSDAGAARKLESQPLARMPVRRSLAEGTAYAGVLDRYLGRLTAAGDLPRALTVLRAQLDRNPNDPLLYERLATFFQQNNLSAQQEQIYQQALEKFGDRSYYDKLARLYLRERKREAFGELTRKVTDIFSGTELDGFFRNVVPGQPVGPQLALELNRYAAQRFPHDLVFTRNLLRAYQTPATRDGAAYEALLRAQWWESDELRDEFLTYLSRTGKLAAELARLEAMNGQAAQQGAQQAAAADPAAVREQAEIEVFRSHFEQAAPLLGAVADLYPGDADTGDRAVSLYRSLAYLDAGRGSTLRAVGLEKNLLAAAPDSPERLATLGDLYAEATSAGGEDVAAAAPYWRRIPELHPGSTEGYLTSATIFWDYFQFDDALGEIRAARDRFHSPALFGYEAGAIEENRHDVAAAVAEYTRAVTDPIAIPRHFDSALGVIDAWLKPPSDAGDSNFRSTAQSFLGSEEANARLLQLAARPGARASVDEATARAAAENPANTAALTLRADVLAAQHTGAELTPLLTALFEQALGRAATLDEVAAVGGLAQARGLTAVYESALGKQAGLTADPVEKIELEYTLARSLEGRGEVAAAARVMDTVYAANPRILGVVRATTDFYGRTNQPARAIGTLLEAAKAATPALARDFTLEAAGRANDANDTAQARALGMGLLAGSPYDARVLDIIATSYARAGDDAGLKQFYLAQLDAAGGAPGLSGDARRQDIALLRRGLIPALTRLGDFAGATDQYLALLAAFPEDAGLGGEAALYALKHDRQAQLLDFLRTAVKQSPRDSRFMILLGASEATFGDLAGAEAAYTQAIAIRKDRADLYRARADIELRLGQTDAAEQELAAADFERLYVLTYHDPAWMVRLAELRARQRRGADAVKALEAAYIDGHAKAAADCFTVAAQLERWNLIAEARGFAEQGVALAGAELLTPAAGDGGGQGENGAVVYARILARAGQAEQALTTLAAARGAAEAGAASPAALAAELARENISGDEAEGFRQNFAAQRRQLADQTLRAAVDALGGAIATYDTPEQKQAFGLALDRLHDPAQANAANAALALEAATAAGLADREAAWRLEGLPAGDGNTTEVGVYVALERRRLQFAELGRNLEAYAGRVAADRREPALAQAAEAYRDAGDGDDEMRLMRGLVQGGDQQLRARYFALLQGRDPAALTALAGSGDAGLADAALEYMVAHAGEAQALAAVANRGRTLDPVWRPASAALVETYFASPAAGPVNTADFDEALGTKATIGARIGHAGDPSRQLTGDAFFYYASRYGIFLETVRDRTQTLPEADDYLPAELEGAPESAERYVNLARSYAEAHAVDRAVGEYGHALELTPLDPAIEDEMALTLERAGRRDEALSHWRAALAILSRMQQRGEYPDAWFRAFETVTRHVGEFGLSASCRPEVEGIAGAYVAKNGNYRSNELLEAVYRGSATPAEGAELIVTVANSAADPNQILTDLSGAAWLAAEAREAILLREMELAREQPARDAGFGHAYELIDLYLDEDRVAKAQAIFDAIPEKQRGGRGDADAIVLAARGGRVQGLIDGWRANPERVSREALGAAIARLMKATAAYQPDWAAIRPLEEFLFESRRQNNELTATDFLALAQLRMDTGDLAGALDLLRQLTLEPAGDAAAGAGDESSAGDETAGGGAAGESSAGGGANPYVNTDYAAALLEKSGHAAEAIPFLDSLVKSVPWDAWYRLRLARAELAAGGQAAGAGGRARAELIAVAGDGSAPYHVRVEAARALGSVAGPAAELGSGELDLVAHPRGAAAARQPYFAEARIAAAAAEGASSAGEREALLREAIAMDPGGADASGADAGRARLDLLLQRDAGADAGATLAILRTMESAAGADADGGAGDGGSGDGGDAGGAAIASPDEVAVPAVALPPGALALDAAARVRLATLLAGANEREGDLEAALAYAELAVREAGNAPAAAVTRRRDELRTAVLLERRNRMRRPALHAALEQANQVRPRLTAISDEVSR